MTQQVELFQFIDEHLTVPLPGRPKRSRAENLERVLEHDWTFRHAKTQGGTHGIHPYPAKFIPQIPRRLIELLHPGDDSFVLDPFCGSGTTLVEAQALGHGAVGIDVNPLAALLARVKTSPPAERLMPLARQLIREAVAHPASIPVIPRIDHWFQPDVQDALARLVHQINSVADLCCREALQIALCSIIVRVSNQESDTRYAAIKKRGNSFERVFDFFEHAVAALDHAFDEQFPSPIRGNPASVTIIQKNILALDPAEIPGRVGLVVTSPPYPNAYEYWLYHKYRMYWLGMDPVAVRHDEIGARPHYFTSNPQTEADFEHQMAAVFALLASAVSSNGLVCFVVGRSIIRGRLIDNLAILERAASSHGFRRLLAVERDIPTTRKAFNPSHSLINSEKLAIFGR